MATNASCAKTSWPDREERNPMPATSLRVTHAPAGTVDDVAHERGKPLFRGTGDTDYVCGNCGSVIATNMGPGQRVIVDTATCAKCGAENEFPPQLRA
jgi:DNA-directed RNA polymerase subunit RPC12/RpoP